MCVQMLNKVVLAMETPHGAVAFGNGADEEWRTVCQKVALHVSLVFVILSAGGAFDAHNIARWRRTKVSCGS